MKNKIIEYLSEDIPKNAIMINDIENGCEYRNIGYDSIDAVATFSESGDFLYAHIRGRSSELANELFSQILNSVETEKEIRVIIPEDKTYIIKNSYKPRKPDIELLRLKKENRKTFEPRYEVSVLNESDKSYIENSFHDDERRVKSILQQLKNKNSVYGIIEGDSLISMITILFRYPPIVMLDNGYTSKDKRGMGYVTSILDFLVKELFDTENFNEIQLYTSVDNNIVHSFTAKRGFEKYCKFKKFSFSSMLVKDKEVKQLDKFVLKD
ncbi:MAG: GNAT family N-acetyltransferase [Candidatus Aenigmarchaeota archaeon]|nr:GNAT family N-acetyltransferase [Candidatus Aenigmarchaeota archaeon]